MIGGLVQYSLRFTEPPPQPNDPAVLDWVRACEPRPLMIVDPMIAFHGGDENDASETRAFTQQCRTVADLGGTVLLLHHDGKAGTSKDYHGSSDFKASLEADIAPELSLDVLRRYLGAVATVCAAAAGDLNPDGVLGGHRHTPCHASVPGAVGA